VWVKDIRGEYNRTLVLENLKETGHFGDLGVDGTCKRSLELRYYKLG
jgi:hypothetical protein